MSRGADRLSLLAPVTEILRSRSIPFALIGAAAMAVHGISRSTRDLDLFTLARECLESSTWAPLARAGIEARLRLGDTDDPLAGVARFTAAGDDPVDLIVGKSRWQVGILDRSREEAVEGTRVPVAGPADLIATCPTKLAHSGRAFEEAAEDRLTSETIVAAVSALGYTPALHPA